MGNNIGWDITANPFIVKFLATQEPNPVIDQLAAAVKVATEYYFATLKRGTELQDRFLRLTQQIAAEHVDGKRTDLFNARRRVQDDLSALPADKHHAAEQWATAMTDYAKVLWPVLKRAQREAAYEANGIAKSFHPHTRILSPIDNGPSYKQAEKETTEYKTAAQAVSELRPKLKAASDREQLAITAASCLVQELRDVLGGNFREPSEVFGHHIATFARQVAQRQAA